MIKYHDYTISSSEYSMMICTPWRPTAVMSTAGHNNHLLVKTFITVTRLQHYIDKDKSDMVLNR